MSRKCQIKQQETREADPAFLIANHALEMPVILKFQCVHFEKKYSFALVVLNWFPI